MGTIEDRFGDFARSAMPRAPIYAGLAARAAGDPAVWSMLESAPPEQRMPVLLFAAVHDVVLRGDAPELAAHYPTATHAADPGDAWPAFRATCRRMEPELRATIARRSTQTNEVGRCALLVPVLGLLAAEVGPLALAEVGASAGLNLLVDRYHYHYDAPGAPTRALGGPSPVTLECGTRGALPLPEELVVPAARLGLDAAPVDPADPERARWLEACVWADEPARRARLHAALGIGRAARERGEVTVRQGDAVHDLAALVEEAAVGGHPVVVTSWVLPYLDGEQQAAFVALLDRLGSARDLSWIALESPRQVPVLPHTDSGPALDRAEQRTVVALARWRSGVRTMQHLAVAHPHGHWIHWLDRAS